jgi:broad specificity phosphatase PhoE
MTRFYLVRHGEKVTPDELLVARAPGVDLSERGRAQAEAIAARLVREPIRHVASSPLERAQQTAAPLAARFNLPVSVDEAFNEFDFGQWTRRSVHDLADDVHWKRFNAFRGSTRPPGGETMLEIQSRFLAGMLRLRGEFPDQGVAIYSHGDPIRAAVAYFAGSPIDFWPRFEISVGSITTILLSEDSVQIWQVNEVPLPR